MEVCCLENFSFVFSPASVVRSVRRSKSPTEVEFVSIRLSGELRRISFSSFLDCPKCVIRCELRESYRHQVYFKV